MKKTIILLSMLAAGVASCATSDMAESTDFGPPTDNNDYLAYDDVQVDAGSVSEEIENSIVSENSETDRVTTSFDYAEKVIREAYMGIEVLDYETSMDRLKTAMSSVDGYISNEYEYFSGTGVSNDVTIRVANKDFDFVVDQITEIAEVVYNKTVNSTDVTEEYVDLQSRLVAQQVVLERYYALLDDAQTIDAVLRVENEITYANQELERIKGRLNYLGNKTSYSTITVHINKPGEEPYMQANTFGDRVGSAFSSGFEVVKFIFLALIYAWPLLLLLAGGFVTFKVVRAKRT